MIRLAVTGAQGRMGRCVLGLAGTDARFEIVARLERDSPKRLPACDVLIDFTDASGTAQWLELCIQGRVAMVIGATGQDEHVLAEIRAAAKVIPIVKAANFSFGVQTMLEAAALIARELGEAYDVEIVETHHRNKLDAPSGTALAIAAAITHQNPGRQGGAPSVIHGRTGTTGIRPKGEIAIHAVRMGEVVGRHEVHFSGFGETLTLTHTAQSRDAFAAGALRAAAWIVGKPPRMYPMADVV